MAQPSQHPTKDATVQAALAERRQQAHRLAIRGLSYRQIAAELGVSHQTVANDLKAWTAEVRDPLVNERRQLESDRLDDLIRLAYDVLGNERMQLVVSEGRVIRWSADCSADRHTAVNDCTCEPLLDSRPIVQAIETIRKLSESKRKLWGTDVPVKQEVEITAPAKSPDEELRELVEQLGLNDSTHERETQ